MRETAVIEKEQQDRYPGLTVRRDGNAVVVHIPAQFRQRRGRRVVLPDGVAPKSAKDDRKLNQPLVEALARGHRWQEQLEAGKHASIDDLAKEHTVDRSYVGRMLRLTSLAPDIVEAILRGDEPEGMSLEKLRRELPVVWGEQRKHHHYGAGSNDGSPARAANSRA
jgi:hypothetical protein